MDTSLASAARFCYRPEDLTRESAQEWMNYYAHTAEDDQGNRLPETSWQPLAAHLRNAAALAWPFAEPYSLAAEAELAGLLHDCVKDSLAIGTGN